MKLLRVSRWEKGMFNDQWPTSNSQIYLRRWSFSFGHWLLEIGYWTFISPRLGPLWNREFCPAIAEGHHRKVPKRSGPRGCWFCGAMLMVFVWRIGRIGLISRVGQQVRQVGPVGRLRPVLPCSALLFLAVPCYSLLLPSSPCHSPFPIPHSPITISPSESPHSHSGPNFLFPADIEILSPLVQPEMAGKRSISRIFHLKNAGADLWIWSGRYLLHFR